MRKSWPHVLLAALAITGLGGCAQLPLGGGMQASLSDRDCLARAMYFESNRSSEDGMLAVGTTVMNRLAAPNYPKTVCGVVGQRNQYAEGVLRNPMNTPERKRAEQVADAVLAGKRHQQVGSAMFFHTAGLTFPYHNMHYVAVAGGNAFYEKVRWSSETSTFSQTASVNPPTRHFASRSKPSTLWDLIRYSGAEAAARSRRMKMADMTESYQPRR